MLASSEVYAGVPYNQSCDVYSFGVVLYEMIKLKRAFDFCDAETAEEFSERIFKQGQRPDVKHIRAPTSIKELFEFSWNPNPEYRYSMENINLILRKELILLRKGDESTLPDFTRRRSTFVFRNGSSRSREGSSRSFAESVESILSVPEGGPNGSTSRSPGRKRQNLASLQNLDLSFHSLDDDL